MRQTVIVLAVLALIGGGVAIAASSASNDVLKDPSRADRPGLIECPLTGEMICADECPLASPETDSAKGDGSDADVPPCCRDK